MKAFPPERVGRRPGVVFGLSFVPTLAPDFPDDLVDLPGYLRWRGGQDDNSPAALALVEGLARGSRHVLEIGVALYEPAKSFTHRILRAKDPAGVYLGVDLADRAAAVAGAPNAHFLRANSFQQGAVRARLAALGVDALDLLLIDGCHSVDACVNDWRYADLVRPGGVVLVHDTNSHPGPVALAAAIDRSVFSVDEPLAGAVDYGLAVCRRLA